MQFFGGVSVIAKDTAPTGEVGATHTSREKERKRVWGGGEDRRFRGWWGEVVEVG